MASKCAATSKSTGKKCKHNHVEGSIYCAAHKAMFEKTATGQETASNAGDGWENELDIFDEDFLKEVAQQPTASHISLPLVAPTPPVMVTQAVVSVPDIDAITNMMDDLTLKLNKLKKLKKVVANMDAEVEKKALSLFYHHNKLNQTVLTELRGKLQSVGLYLVKGNKECIPYEFVKEYTSNAFANLPIEQKNMYMEEARKLVRARMVWAR